MHPTPPPVLSQRNTNHQHPNRYFYNNNTNSNNSTENDAISLNGNSNSPLQTYPPQQSHNMPLFQNHHRRKGRAGRSMFHETDHTRDHNTAATSLVQNAMKLILLSPVLVLVIWSVTAITWTNHQMKMQQHQQLNTGSTSYTRSSTRRQQQQQRNTNQSWSLLPFRNRRTVTASQQPPPPLQQQQYILPSPQQQGTLIVQPPFLIPPSPELLTQLEPPKPGSSEDYYQDPIPIGMRLEQQEQPVVVMNPEMASAGNKNYYYSFPDQQQQQQQSVKSLSIAAAATNSIAVYDPITGKTQYYYSFPEQQQSATLTDTSEHPEHLPIVMDTAPEIVPALEEPLVVPLSQQQQQQPMSSLSLHGTQGSAKDNHHHFLRHDTNNNKNNHHASSNQNNIKYYFYDPRDIKNDQHHNNGNVHLPQYVYDSLGRLIPFKSLAASTFKKSPSVTMIHPNSTVLNATVYNYTHTHPPVVDTRQKRKMSFPSNPKQYLTNWTTSAMHHYNQEHGSSSSSQQPPMADSSIIICTVGVMALFVGALSARRMRSHQQRSILSMCIENEQLDHDAAYDTIYTTTTNPNNTIFGSNHYNTFAQGWKGDLEKFDV